MGDPGCPGNHEEPALWEQLWPPTATTYQTALKLGTGHPLWPAETPGASLSQPEHRPQPTHPTQLPPVDPAALR